MDTYRVDFSPYDYRIYIEATSPEEAIRIFKDMNKYDLMTKADRLDGLHEPLDPFAVSTWIEVEEDYRFWSYDADTQKLIDM